MDLAHESVEMHAALAGHQRALEEQVHQHGLAAPDLAMDVKAARRFGFFGEQARQEGAGLLAGRQFGREVVERAGDLALRRVGLEVTGPDPGLKRFENQIRHPIAPLRFRPARMSRVRPRRVNAVTTPSFKGGIARQAGGASRSISARLRSTPQR